MTPRASAGDVVQFELPTGAYAYARVLRRGFISVYSDTTDEPGNPPVGSREYAFTVAVYEGIAGSDCCPVVG